MRAEKASFQQQASKNQLAGDELGDGQLVSELEAAENKA